MHETSKGEAEATVTHVSGLVRTPREHVFAWQRRVALFTCLAELCALLVCFADFLEVSSTVVVCSCITPFSSRCAHSSAHKCTDLMHVLREQKKTGAEVPAKHPIMAWMVEHAGTIPSLFSCAARGDHGLTPAQMILFRRLLTLRIWCTFLSKEKEMISV